MFASIFSGVDDMIVIVVALVVVFGGSQLPKLAHNTGEALREFRKARSEAADEHVPERDVVPVATANLQAVTAGPETVTLTRAQLDAMLSVPPVTGQQGPPAAQS